MCTQNKHNQQQRDSHESAALHTVFTAPLNYWLVVFLCYERPPYMNRKTGLLIKTATELLSNQPAHYWPPGLPPKQDTCFSWHCLTLLLIVTVFFHYLLFVSFILISLSPFIIPSPPPLPRQNSLVQGTLLEGTADRAQQNITHKPLVNDKLLIITYSWKYRKVLLGRTGTQILR